MNVAASLTVHRRIATALFALFLSIQVALVLATPIRPPGYDELYYLRKAQHFIAHGSFPRAGPEEMDILMRRKWGTADWRPQGYPLFIALVSGLDPDPLTMKGRVALAQTAGAALVVSLLFGMAVRRARHPAAFYGLALMLGLQPWTFEFVIPLISDTLTMVLAAAGLIALARYAEGQSSWRWLVAGSAAISASFLVRPDMLPMAPLLVGVAVLRRFGLRRAALRPMAIGAAVVVLFFGVEIGYRIYFTGKPALGKFVFMLGGAYDWAHTWFATEREGYENFVYLVDTGTVRIDSIPDRAFASSAERRRVAEILEGIRQSGSYSEESDRAFKQLAKERVRERPFVRGVLTRLWRTAMLWTNTDTSPQHLHALARLPGAVRRPILAGLLALRWCIYLLAAIVAFGLVRRGFRKAEPLDLLALTFLAGRVFVIGIVMGSMVHRLMLPAWPALLWLASASLLDVTNRFSRSSVTAHGGRFALPSAIREAHPEV